MQIEGLGGRRITGLRREEGGGGTSRGAAICVQRQSGDHSLWGVGGMGGCSLFLLKHTKQTKTILLFRGRLYKLGLLTKICY